MLRELQLGFELTGALVVLVNEGADGQALLQEEPRGDAASGAVDVSIDGASSAYFALEQEAERGEGADGGWRLRRVRGRE
jgi:hypothetical protein